MLCSQEVDCSNKHAPVMASLLLLLLVEFLMVDGYGIVTVVASFSVILACFDVRP